MTALSRGSGARASMTAMPVPGGGSLEPPGFPPFSASSKKPRAKLRALGYCSNNCPNNANKMTDPETDAVPLAEAARRLGTTTDALRMRFRRGKIEGFRRAGRIFLRLPPGLFDALAAS